MSASSFKKAQMVFANQFRSEATRSHLFQVTSMAAYTYMDRGKVIFKIF